MTDYRYGNLLKVKATGELITVQSWNVDGINLYVDTGIITPKYRFDEVGGVPITVEILNNTSLKYLELERHNEWVDSGKWKVLHIQKYKIEDTSNLCYFMNGTACITTLDGTVVKELSEFHQLQNIYFDLTYKRLQYDLGR